MSCRICGRYGCSESFHSIEEQVAYEKGVVPEDVEILEERITHLEAKLAEAKADSERWNKMERAKASIRLTHFEPARWEVSYSTPEGHYGLPCIQRVPANKTPRAAIDKLEEPHE